MRAEMKEKYLSEDEFEREVRRSRADWEFINRQPPKIKAALRLFIETGDSYKAAKLAGLTVDEFEELRIEARIPKVVLRERS